VVLGRDGKGKKVVAQTELFLDAGQSAVKIRAVTGSDTTTLSLSRVDTSRPIAPQIVFAATQFAEQTSVKPWRLTVSSTALSQPEQTAHDILTGVRNIGVSEVQLAHDSIGGYLSAVGTDFGAVAAVGTGVVTLGVGPAGFARVDGWGNIIGDAGSGYWIGRRALESAMRAHDGRGAETKLYGVMAEHFPSIEDAYLELQRDPEKIFRVASFAKPTIELADEDPVASDIVDRAVNELVVSISAALTRAGFTRGDSPVISWTGSVATNPSVSSRLEIALISAWPAATFVPPLGEPIDGVQQMVSLDPAHPLFPHISVAT
jgi:glucosamine kinase